MSQSWDHCHWEGLRILSVCLKIAPHYLGPDPEVAGVSESETSLHHCLASLFNCDIGNTPLHAEVRERSPSVSPCHMTTSRSPC